jgi:diguanylate cyclase (GGDEF)-like protein
MHLTLALNAILGSALIIVLIFADYVRKFNTDLFQRNVFCGLLIFSFIPMMGDMAYLLLKGLPGGTFYPQLIWPCMTSALLYAYFFIIRSNTRLDSLTGIGNRFSFNEFTDRLGRLENGESWGFVMLDMDHFKAINDTLGHQEGDKVLCDMAAIIKSSVGPSDFAARYGGDEFVLATKTKNRVAPLMRRIQEALDQYNAKLKRPFKLEISYGFDVYTADGSRSLKEFLTHLDSLMYKHKRDRRRAGDKRAEAAL